MQPITHDDSAHGETVNNGFRQQIDSSSGATGTILEKDGVLYVRKCLHCEYCYKSCEIYSDTDESTTISAHSTDSWSLYDSAPPLKDNPISILDNNFDQWLLEENRQMVHQGFLDEYSDYNVFEADLEEAQEPLKPSI